MLRSPVGDRNPGSIIFLRSEEDVGLGHRAYEFRADVVEITYAVCVYVTYALVRVVRLSSESREMGLHEVEQSF